MATEASPPKTVEEPENHKDERPASVFDPKSAGKSQLHTSINVWNVFAYLERLARRWKPQISHAEENACEEAIEWQAPQVEDFRPGYPQLAALIGSHPSFNVYRRFLRARARLLLLKQDDLCLLESQLDQIDNDEKKALFLGNRRRDTNGERRRVLTELDAALTGYDAMLDRNRKILTRDQPRKADVQNLQNWVANTNSLARDETAYLSKTADLMTVLTPHDTAVARLTPTMEKIMRSFFKLFEKPCNDISRDPHVSVFSVSLLEAMARALIACSIVVALLVPIIVISTLASLALRIATIVIASVVLIMALSSFTNARTLEVFVGGATYATVLVVFISGNGAKGN